MVVRPEALAVVDVFPEVGKVELRVAVIPTALEVVAAALAPVELAPRDQHDGGLEVGKSGAGRLVLEHDKQLPEVGVGVAGPGPHGRAAKRKDLRRVA